MRSVLSRACCWAWALCMWPAWAAPEYSYRIVATRPHDATAFTEGLAIHDGRIYESTGRNGESRLIVREWPSLKPIRSVHLVDSDFGEGLAVLGKRIFQLTWKGGRGYVYDLGLRRLGQFPISSEGWGLTQDGQSLIRSDGSSELQFLDPTSFRELRRLQVRDGASPVSQLNELELVRDRLFANVWLTDLIAMIDPRSGQVIGWLDLSPLKQRFVKPPDWDANDNVLNGIAWDERRQRLVVTGKCWPQMFELEIGGIKKQP